MMTKSFLLSLSALLATVIAHAQPSSTPLKHTRPLQLPLCVTKACFNAPSSTPLKHTHPHQSPLCGHVLCFNRLPGPA